MDIKDILKLVDAGFTAAQITELTKEPPVSVPAEPEEAKAVPESTPSVQAAEPVQQQPAPAPVQAPVQNIQQASNEALLKELKDLRMAIQAGNIRQNGPAPGPKQTVEEILASIVEP